MTRKWSTVYDTTCEPMFILLLHQGREYLDIDWKTFFLFRKSLRDNRYFISDLRNNILYYFVYKQLIMRLVPVIKWSGESTLEGTCRVVGDRSTYWYPLNKELRTKGVDILPPLLSLMECRSAIPPSRKDYTLQFKNRVSDQVSFTISQTRW